MDNRNIVFLSGWAIDCKIFSKISQHYPGSQLINYFDLPDLSLKNSSAFLLNQIPDNSIIIAWSFGGSLAVDFCNRHPHKCRKLILIASTPRFLEDEKWAGLDPMFVDNLINESKGDLKAVLEKFMSWVAFPSKDRNQRETLKNNRIEFSLLIEHLSFFLNLDLRKVYQNIQQPILNILGLQDAIVKSSLAEALKGLNLGARISVMEGAGHMPFLTHEAEFLKIMDEFINDDQR